MHHPRWLRIASALVIAVAALAPSTPAGAAHVTRLAPFAGPAIAVSRTPQASPSTLADQERLMLQLVNQARAEAGVPPLALDPRVAALARQKSADIVQNRYWSHTSPTYGSPSQMLRKAGIRFRYGAENLAKNLDARWAHDALMKSPLHRKNILNPKFTRVGIGIVPYTGRGVVVTQLFIGE